MQFPPIERFTTTKMLPIAFATDERERLVFGKNDLEIRVDRTSKAVLGKAGPF